MSLSGLKSLQAHSVDEFRKDERTYSPGALPAWRWMGQCPTSRKAGEDRGSDDELNSWPHAFLARTCNHTDFLAYVIIVTSLQCLVLVTVFLADRSN